MSAVPGSCILDFTHERSLAPRPPSRPRTTRQFGERGAVRTSRQSCEAEAISLLERAVGASSGAYSYPRWNLGVVMSHRGLSHFVESQGWFAAAIRADSELRDKEAKLLFDDSIYFTTLDLSRPLPPDWHFATSAHMISLVLGIGLLIGAGLQEVAWELGSHTARERFMESAEHGRLEHMRLWGRHIPAGVMVGLAGLALYFIARTPTSTVAETLFLALGAMALAFAVMRLRAASARRSGAGVAQYSWTPALVVMTVATGLHSAFGLPLAYAPPPFAEGHPELRRFHALGPILLSAAAIGLLLFARWTRVPLTFELGFAAFVIAFSVLTPIPPHDGGYLGRFARRCALLGVVAVAFLIGTHVL